MSIKVRGRVSRWEVSVIALLLLLFLLQSALSAKRKSLTIDEYVHMGAASSYIYKNYYALNAVHPPFSKVISGLAFLPFQPVVPDLPPEGTRLAQKLYGIQFMQANRERIDSISFIGRFPHMVIALFMGVGIWWISRTLFGILPALFTLFLWSTDPNILAHARLVCTDTDVTTFVCGTIVFFLLAIQGAPSWKRSCLFSLCLGLALMTKFSAIVLLLFIPFLLIVWLTGTLLGWNSELDRTEVWIRARKVGIRLLVASLVIVPILALLLYRGQVEWWFRGFFGLLQHNERGHLGYLLGEWSRKGWWYYFPVVLLVKTPVPLMGLALLGLVRMVKGFRSRSSFMEFLLFLPMLLWLGFAIASSINLGIRHILPSYVFLFILSAGGIAWLLKECGRKRVPVILLALLFVWQCALSIRTFPDYIPYFNEIAGGPDKGSRYLVDSNLDWGQELISLAEWIQKEEISGVVLRTLGAPIPDLYGVRTARTFDKVPSREDPAYLAMGATTYMKIMFAEDDKYEEAREFLGSLEPVTTLGHSLTIYRVTTKFPSRFNF